MSRRRSNALQQELVDFRGFQESQVAILNNISRSLENNLSFSNRLSDSLASIQSSMESMTNNSNNLEIERMRFQNQMQRREQELHDRYSASRLRSIQREEEAIADAMRRLEELGDRATEIDLERTRLQVENLMSAEERMASQLDDNIAGFKQLGTIVLSLAKSVAETANKFSQISNDLISVSGASALEVRDSRKTIVRDIISQLNKETGTFFNPEASYEKMVAIAREANIGSLEVIEEITRPVLLASESLDINNGELAGILSKWYTRYNFSSREMEAMVDEIRGNTAGNNATAEATLQNISKFQNFIGVYADNTQEMQNMMAAISAETSRLESAGINSGYVFDYMYQIGTGDLSNAPTIMSLLANSGTDLDWNTANSMLRSGNEDDMKLVSKALADGAINLMDKLKDSSVSAEAIKAYGADYEELLNMLSASGAVMTPEQFKESVADATSSIEAIDGKFNTVSDKLTNFMKYFGEVSAGIQETLGVGFSDFIQIGTNIYTVIALSKMLGGGRGNLPGAGTLGRVATSVGGRLTAAGSAIGLSGTAATVAGGAGALAGGALAIDGVKGLFDKGSSTAEKALSGVELAGGIGGTAAILGLGLSNPIGWAALAVGGIAFLGKKAVQHAKTLDSEAENTASKLSEANESLAKENENRLKRIGELDSQFIQEEEIRSRYNSIYPGQPSSYAASASIPGYAEGSNYISSDRIAKIHEGEAIIPKKYNPAANTSELEMLRDYYRESSKKENSEVVSTMKEFASTLTEIKEFLAYWKDDNSRRDMSRERSSKFAYNSYKLSHYELT